MVSGLRIHQDLDSDKDKQDSHQDLDSEDQSIILKRNHAYRPDATPNPLRFRQHDPLLPRYASGSVARWLLLPGVLHMDWHLQRRTDI